MASVYCFLDLPWSQGFSLSLYRCLLLHMGAERTKEVIVSKQVAIFMFLQCFFNQPFT